MTTTTEETPALPLSDLVEVRDRLNDIEAKLAREEAPENERD
ncbi:hypothetical protein ABZT17_25210 [Streptomyces sp. NPDC005648]